MEDKITSIRCKTSTLAVLEELKIYPRETYEEVILRIAEELKK